MVTDYERARMRHALGLDQSSISYRNGYACQPASPDEAVWQSLAVRGLASFSHRMNEAPNTLHVWRVTEAGEALVS